MQLGSANGKFDRQEKRKIVSSHILDNNEVCETESVPTRSTTNYNCGSQPSTMAQAIVAAWMGAHLHSGRGAYDISGAYTNFAPLLYPKFLFFFCENSIEFVFADSNRLRNYYFFIIYNTHDLKNISIHIICVLGIDGFEFSWKFYRIFFTILIFFL